MPSKKIITKKNRLASSKCHSAFTLIEIIVSIAIVGILAGIVILSYNGWQKSVTIAQIKSDLNGVASAMENARTFGSNGYPTSIPSTFTKSDSTITLSGGSTDGGKTYCIDGTSSKYSTVHFYISSISGNQSIQSGVCITAPTLSIGAITGSSIDLSWTSITGAISYTLQRDTNSSFTSATTIATQSGTSFTSGGLSSGTTYYYRVNATNADSTSAWSATVSATVTIAAPSSPTIAVTLSAPNVLATITPVTCTGATTQYQINSRTNDGSWTGWSAWSTTTTATQTANDGVKYGYQAQARCYIDASNYSTTATGTESTYIDPIPAPSAPVVAANTVSSTTTWSWPTVTCTTGTASYRYDYTITPSGYDSGWVSNGTALSVAFTTSTAGQTYTVAVQANCSIRILLVGGVGVGARTTIAQQLAPNPTHPQAPTHLQFQQA